MTRLSMALLLLLSTAVSCAAVITVHDDRGHTLRLDAPARRIVSLAPHLTELLFAAGAGQWVVGTSTYTDYPAAAQRLPRIGDSAALDIERIVALRPDLVVAWQSGNPPQAVAKLERLGLRVLVLEPGSLDGIAAEIETLGRIAGSEPAAAAAAARFRGRVLALRREYQGRRKMTLFYQVWRAPLMTVGGRQVISEVIDLCGGVNIFAGLDALVPTVSREAVLAADPQAIVTASEQPVAEALGGWRRWRSLQAVRNGNLMVIPADDISRATPRLLDGARRLCQALDAVRNEAAVEP
jgi:iron complex transport system substrate-binding protein